MHHPSAPNGDRTRPSRVIAGLIRSLPALRQPSRQLPVDTEAPLTGSRAKIAGAPRRPLSNRLRTLAASALLIAAISPWAAAELPAQPQISLIPQQTAAVGMGQWQNGDYQVEALARYDVTARVLSARSYDQEREAEVSPIDFALGWGPMADRDLLQSLSVEQRDRWYFVRWRNAPIRAEDVIANSANTHMIPSSPEIAEQLAAVRPGDIVRLQGYLVRVEAEDGWSWRSSTVRTDTGDGSCEVLWVESVEVFSDAPITYAALD